MEQAINKIKKHLEEALRKKLPGISSHQKMLPPERNLSYPEKNSNQIKKSSVLVLIYPEGDELYTCLMKRPHTMKHHPGQISFPGGRIEEGDKDEICAALREANEEVGLCSEEIEVIGALSNLYVSVSNFEISPIVGISAKKPELRISSEEVEEIFFFPLLKQLSMETYPLTTIETTKGNLTVPCFYLENKIVWGATAMILSELFDVLKEISLRQE